MFSQTVLLLFAFPLAHSVDLIPYNPIHFDPYWSNLNLLDYDPILDIAQQNCSAELHKYKTPTEMNPTDELPAAFTTLEDWVLDDLINCIYSKASETTKLNIGAGSILLGLLPSILCLAGSSTTEVGLLATRRPLLAFLLSAGSPALNSLRTFGYRDPVTTFLIDEKEDGLRVWQPTALFWRVAFVAAQYAVALGCITNTLTSVWSLTYRVIFIVKPTWDWMPILWVCLAMVIHIIGIISVRRRVRIERASKRSCFGNWWRDELQSCLHQEQVKLLFRKESKIFIFFAWKTFLATVFHVLFGTFIFSSLIFIQVRGAAQFAGRIAISMVASRIILRWELSYMRQTTTVPARYAEARQDEELGRTEALKEGILRRFGVQREALVRSHEVGSSESAGSRYDIRYR